jgi:hypothetical protein
MNKINGLGKIADPFSFLLKIIPHAIPHIVVKNVIQDHEGVFVDAIIHEVIDIFMN